MVIHVAFAQFLTLIAVNDAHATMYQYRQPGLSEWHSTIQEACDAGAENFDNSGWPGQYSSTWTAGGSAETPSCATHTHRNWYGDDVYGTQPLEWQIEPLYFVALVRSQKADSGSCCSTQVGDPINVANRSVFASEEDFTHGTIHNEIVFNRFYNSNDLGNNGIGAGWRHSFSRSVQPRYNAVAYQPYLTANADYSSFYHSAAAACSSGFSEIKARANTWSNAIASYSGGVCSLSLNSTPIGTLPIFYASENLPSAGPTLLGFDVTRDDGQVVSFTVSGSSILAPSGNTLKLQQIGSGYTLTDSNDNVESYNNNGKLLSITHRTGVVQTISYDSLGRLSGIADNFGHSLTLTYDNQGRLSTVTR